MSTSESEEDGDGDGNAAFLENSEIDFEDEFGTVPTMSPLLQTVSGSSSPFETHETCLENSFAPRALE